MRVSLMALIVSLLPGMAEATGEQTFGAQCARCHAPIEIKRRLLGDWSGRTAEQLYLTTRQTMPGESPGSLSDADYLAVLAYMLDLADVDRPDGELTTAALADILIAARERNAGVERDVPWKNFGGELSAQRYAPLDQHSLRRGRRALGRRGESAPFV